MAARDVGSAATIVAGVWERTVGARRVHAAERGVEEKEAEVTGSGVVKAYILGMEMGCRVFWRCGLFEGIEQILCRKLED